MSAFTSQFWADGQCLMICTFQGKAPELSCDGEHNWCHPGPNRICQNQCYDALNRDNEALHGLDRLRQPPWQLSEKTLMQRSYEVHERQDPGRFTPGLISFDLSNTSMPLHAPIPHLIVCNSSLIHLYPLDKQKDLTIPWNCGGEYGRDTPEILKNLGYYAIDDNILKYMFKPAHDQAVWATNLGFAEYIANMCQVYFGGLYPDYREKDGERYYSEKRYCEKTLTDIENGEKAGDLGATLDHMVCRNLKNDVDVPSCNGHRKDLPFCNALKHLKQSCKKARYGL